jgi:hypothetical protein
MLSGAFGDCHAPADRMAGRRYSVPARGRRSKPERLQRQCCADLEAEHAPGVQPRRALLCARRPAGAASPEPNRTTRPGHSSVVGITSLPKLLATRHRAFIVEGAFRADRACVRVCCWLDRAGMRGTTLSQARPALADEQSASARCDHVKGKVLTRRPPGLPRKAAG